MYVGLGVLCGVVELVFFLSLGEIILEVPGGCLVKSLVELLAKSLVLSVAESIVQSFVKSLVRRSACVCVFGCVLCVSEHVQMSAGAQIHAQISAEISAQIFRPSAIHSFLCALI